MTKIITTSMINKRIETGKLQIDDDWPGLFIRGDDCMLLIDMLYFYRDHSKDEDFFRIEVSQSLIDKIKTVLS